jgi:RNA polymerase sigma-70 factor, ECF subfamily
VRPALTQLSDRQRQAIELAYDAGLSQSEIAKRLNEPLGTVKSWTRQGLLKLKQSLENSIDFGRSLPIARKHSKHLKPG